MKTAGTSYLEALRVIARANASLFLEIILYSLGHFETDRASYHISAKLSEIPRLDNLSAGEREVIFLYQDAGRQILHVTFGSVLTQGKAKNGNSFKKAILEMLSKEAALHKEVLACHLGRHITLLNAG